MKSLDYIYSIFFASIALLIALIVLISKSAFEKNTKVTLYIRSVISPPIGLILYLIFRFRNKGVTNR